MLKTLFVFNFISHCFAGIRYLYSFANYQAHEKRAIISLIICNGKSGYFIFKVI